MPSVPQSDPLSERQRVACQVGQALAVLPHVSAVLVFGSVASGHVDDRSDIDLLVVCEQLPEPEERRLLLSRLGEGPSLGSPSGDLMFPIVDEVPLVGGVPVTLHYQLAVWVEQVLDEAIGHGALTTTQLPFRPYTLAGLIQQALVLEDKKGEVAGWRARIAVFPSALKQNLLAHFAPLLKEQVAELTANAERRLGPRVLLFNLNWAVDALVGLLYALNEVYDPADRRAEHTIWPYFQIAPQNFSGRLKEVLEGPFDHVTAIGKARLFEALALEVLVEVERVVRSSN